MIYKLYINKIGILDFEKLMSEISNLNSLRYEKIDFSSKDGIMYSGEFGLLISDTDYKNLFYWMQQRGIRAKFMKEKLNK